MDNVFLYSKTIEQFFEGDKIKKEYLLELNSCPVCEGKVFKKLFEQYGFNYWRCKICSFVFVNPRLNDDGSLIWYNSDFYNAALETEYFRIKKGERYFSALHPDVFEKILELIQCAGLKKNADVLDIGCGNGAFLEYLKIKSGFENSLGIDLNKKAVGFAGAFRGLNVLQLNVNDFNSGEKFDLIISMESIEHSNDLNNFMSNVRRNSKDKSFFLITTPYNDRKATVIGGTWGDHYMAPNHINFFNLNSMKLLLEKYGFKIHSKKILENYLGADLLKYKLKYKRDWASSLPPLQAEEIVMIPKKENSDLKYVKFKQTTSDKAGEDKSSAKKKNNMVYDLLKNSYHGISDIFNLKWKYHFIILAQKI
jgi:SAM-dependent methyltransferase